MKALGLAAALAATVALGACYRTTYLLQPPGQMSAPSPAYDEQMHLSLLGIFELSSPINLQLACNNAPPVAIHEDVGVLGAIVNLVLSSYLPILHVHNATVLCPVGPPVGQPMGQPMGQPPMPMGQQPMGPPASPSPMPPPPPQ